MCLCVLLCRSVASAVVPHCTEFPCCLYVWSASALALALKMPEYVELTNDEELPSVDPRPIYVTCCFVVVTLCSSLFIFLLMERFADSSFLWLVDDLSTVNVLAAVVLFLILSLTSVAIVAVWIRNRRLLMVSHSVGTMFAVTLVLVLVWAAALQRGAYAEDVRRGFLARNNATTEEKTCPTLTDAKCCGWDVRCNATACPSRRNSTRLCSDLVHDNIQDYVQRVIPIVGIIVAFHIVSTVFACTSQRWKLSSAPKNLLGDVR